MELKDIDSLIRYHQSGLNQYRMFMEPSSQFLEEQTVAALGELRKYQEVREKLQNEKEVTEA